jgi:hypothetical protein
MEGRRWRDNDQAERGPEDDGNEQRKRKKEKKKKEKGRT